MNQGHVTAVAPDALILYSNYLIEQILHMDVKCTVQAIFTAVGAETLVYSNYVKEQSCTWM
jgi:hypothetical protein